MASIASRALARAAPSRRLPRRPTVTICGVAGYNRGDDAIALALVEGLRARLPHMHARVAMIALGSIAATDDLSPFLAARRRPAGLLALAYAIARADLVIIGGGSIIQDKFGGGRVKGIIGYAWLVARLAALFGRPLITAPIGIDAITTERAHQSAAELLASARAIFVRDARSMANCHALVADTTAPQPQMACDPAFALAGASPRAGGPMILSPAFEDEYDELVIDIFARVAAEAVERLDREVVVVSMDSRDDARVARIVAAVPAAARARVSAAYPPTLDVALDVLRGGSALIAMRLHAMILSYGTAPIACLSRTTKTDAFMEDYRVPGTGIGDDTPAAVASLLVEAVASWSQRDEQAAILATRRATLNRFFDTAVALLHPQRASQTA
ncbi:polysaccharide pyruvyl transferase family protein [Sphingomonas sp. RRHST34]|uniref:Polysaccharide pyruvyl transferase family protein n=1 Tax=Sphingomonas citri TaxID=2862499 RepID=A0ABS7BPZ1_9SPHN|nr:polysaccharide pyruvyl transferase family protein [Sphingomonas citri]MBW6531660.1 polysaccharide pyruvyl transferase family protein [Sphingomonas citri]